MSWSARISLSPIRLLSERSTGGWSAHWSPVCRSTVWRFDHRRGDIFINVGEPQADGSLNWTGVRNVTNHGNATDQWNPSIAINPAGTELFVGYYTRQEDSSNNALIKAYAAKTILANGFATATFDVFPISATAFPPLFAGTTSSTPPANTWMYDPV